MTSIDYTPFQSKTSDLIQPFGLESDLAVLGKLTPLSPNVAQHYIECFVAEGVSTYGYDGLGRATPAWVVIAWCRHHDIAFGVTKGADGLKVFKDATPLKKYTVFLADMCGNGRATQSDGYANEVDGIHFRLSSFQSNLIFVAKNQIRARILRDHGEGASVLWSPFSIVPVNEKNGVVGQWLKITGELNN